MWPRPLSSVATFVQEFFVPCFHVPRSRNLRTATSKRGETDDGNRPIYLLRVARPTSTGNVGVALEREKLAADDGIRQISQPIAAEVAARRGVSPKSNEWALHVHYGDCTHDLVPGILIHAEP